MATATDLERLRSSIRGLVISPLSMAERVMRVATAE